MKRTHKLLALLLALVTALALSIPASADGDTYSITINNAVEGSTYKVYKVFDATYDTDNNVINYTCIEGKTGLPTGFVTDDAGNVYHGSKDASGAITVSSAVNLSPEEITAIQNYIGVDNPVKTVKAENMTGNSITISGLTAGYYYITTTTGTVVSVTSAQPNATVEEKNEAPDLDKKITGVTNGILDADGRNALAQVGNEVTYTASITVKAGATNYEFVDTMGKGLTFNKDVVVKVNDEVIENKEGENAKYEVTEGKGTDTFTFKVTFNNDWIKTLIDTDNPKTITITYSGTVNSDALNFETGKNTASLNYGDGNTVTMEEQNVPVVHSASFTVTKTDGASAPLAGAGFVLTKTDNGTTYYYKNTSGTVSWVTNQNDATELTTNTGDDGNIVTFTGLSAGTYTLVEKTVPAGYNKADDKTFTIVSNNYDDSNLAQSATVINLRGSTLPSTGGMGTTIFYIVGGILVLGAVVLLVTKKRMNGEK